MSSIFLSHNSKDKPWVRELAKRLTDDGVTVWLDEAELNIGDSLIERISSAIEQMKFVAAVISPNSIGSAWVQKELSLAMSKEVKGRRVTVLPLLIANCELPASLRDKLYGDFTSPDNYQSEYNKLLRAIGVGPKSTSAPMESPRQSSDRSKGTTAAAEKLLIIGIAKEKTRQDPTYSDSKIIFSSCRLDRQAGGSNIF